MAGLARELNERGVLCPSGADRMRNPHRLGQEWMVGTATGILENPRYTGREVWKPPQHRVPWWCPLSPGRGTAKRTQVKDWVLSDSPVHPALVSDELFLAVQGMRTARRRCPGFGSLLASVATLRGVARPSPLAVDWMRRRCWPIAD
ncbi:recombinase family protein [Saccharopolyspora shandongensis]|uniref:recombinase family protein n=1 Tax=Saccharopolyspora shandongensis TaxID=418495 RepID=UPI003406B329